MASSSGTGKRLMVLPSGTGNSARPWDSKSDLLFESLGPFWISPCRLHVNKQGDVTPVLWLPSGTVCGATLHRTRQIPNSALRLGYCDGESFSGWLPRRGQPPHQATALGDGVKTVPVCQSGSAASVVNDLKKKFLSTA